MLARKTLATRAVVFRLIGEALSGYLAEQDPEAALHRFGRSIALRQELGPAFRRRSFLDRPVTAVVGTGQPNSAGYRLDPAGVILEPYFKLPVLLWEHEWWIVGRAVRVWHDRAYGLMASIRFADTPEGRSVRRRYADGTLSEFSVRGFPIETDKPAADGTRLARRWELFEISAARNGADRGARMLRMLA